MGRVSDKLRNRFDMLAGRIKQQLSKEVTPLDAAMGVKDVPNDKPEGKGNAIRSRK
jgi:hypothetical protein